MKICRIDMDEWWPVYEPSETCGREVEFTDEESERLTRIFSEFKETQSFLREKYRGANA